jgi:spermidine synthase
MRDHSNTTTTNPLLTPLNLLRLLFFLSGISGLIYQVVWMRMLTRILGCTIYASSTVLASFMAGLAIGSFVAGRLVDRSRSPVRWYGILEVGIAISGICLPFVFESLVTVYQAMYQSVGASGSTFLFARAAIIFVLLLVPTAMMGATLPVLSSCVGRMGRDFERHVSWLYGLNTLGAMVGSLTSGLLLLGFLGETWTIRVAAAINVLVGLWAVIRRQALEAHGVSAESDGSAAFPNDAAARSQATEFEPSIRWVVLASFAISGLASLGFEVIWTRQLVLFMGTSIYAFSIMLVLFLGGLGLGSLVGGDSRDRAEQTLPMLAALQCTLGLVGILSQNWMLRMPPGNPYDTESLIVSPGPAIMIFLFAFVSGLMFPRAVRSFSLGARRGGESLGLLYAANTIGCILGSLLTGFVLIPLIGSSRTAVALALLNLIAGLVLWTLAARHVTSRVVRWAVPAFTLFGAALVPNASSAYDQTIVRNAAAVSGPNAELYYHREGAVAATTAFGDPSDPEQARLWVNGVGMTHLGTVTKLMAHLPLTMHGNAEKMLVICFGMGTTVQSAATQPGVAITSVELVPEVYDCFGFFHPNGPELWNRPNVRRVVDDGRNYLLMHNDTYDVITIDPPPPVHSAGTVNLYTRNFFELCRARLSSDGIICLWIPPVAKSELMVIMASFSAVFEHTALWTAPDVRGFYCIGQLAPRVWDDNAVTQYLSQEEVQRDLAEFGFECRTGAELRSLKVLDEQRFRDLVRPYPVMTDDWPYTEFPLWRRLFRSDGRDLYRSDDLMRALGRSR